MQYQSKENIIGIYFHVILLAVYWLLRHELLDNVHLRALLLLL